MPTSGLSLGLCFVPEFLVHALAPEVLVVPASGSEAINCDFLTAIQDTFLDKRVSTRHVWE